MMGRFVSIRAESLQVKPKWNPTVKVPVDDIARIDRSSHRSDAALPGLLLGAVAGMGVTALAVRSEGEAAIWFGYFLVPVGAVIGALAGSTLVDYHWQPVWKRPNGE